MSQFQARPAWLTPPEEDPGKTIEVWITKWLFSEGIMRRNAVEVPEAGAGYIRFRNVGGSGAHLLGKEGKYWHRTEAAALAHAEVMRAEKVTQLKWQIGRIERATFEVHNG